MVKINHDCAAGGQGSFNIYHLINGTINFDIAANTSLPVAFIDNNDGKKLFEVTLASPSNTMGQFTNMLTALNVPVTDINTVSGYTPL